MNKIKLVFSDERIITPSGLGVVGGLSGKSNLIRHQNRMPVDNKMRSELQIKNGDIALTYIGLLSRAKQSLKL